MARVQILVLIRRLSTRSFSSSFRAKTEFDHESSVDNINVSVSSKTASTQSSEKQTVPFSTSWISAVYSKGKFNELNVSLSV